MARAFEEGFDRGLERIVIIGTDCPELTPELLHQAFVALRDHDLVLGPASDGGYYLIGLRRPVPELFRGMPWGTGDVRRRTLEAAERGGISVFELKQLDDVDRPEDLEVWERSKEKGRKLSVVIPALNEADTIAAAAKSASAFSGAEVIVVDGGSHDGTRKIAGELGVTVIDAPRGRASQMNAAARTAEGEILLFLHADSALPDRYQEQVMEILDTPHTVAGAFRLSIRGKSTGLRVVEKSVDLRSRVFKMPYGDQGIFLRKDLFREMGGFSQIPIMEDFELIQRLRARGRIGISPLPVTTSGRRWHTLGIPRTTLVNQLVVSGYLLGVSTERLARWYGAGDWHRHGRARAGQRWHLGQ
jgi:rSAM/selenodomain-associated transferase 2